MIKAIELAHDKDWKKLWIESDYSLVISAFRSKSISLEAKKLVAKLPFTL